jgi:hypothetical protein
VWGWSVLKSGLAIIPTPVTMFITSTVIGRRFKPEEIKRTVGIGLMGIIVSGIGMYFTLDDQPNFWTGYFWCAALYGVSLGFAWANIMASSLVGVDTNKYGAANGTNTTFRTFGSAMGVSIVIAVSGSAGVSGSVAAFHRVFLVLVLLFAVAMVVWLAAYPRNRR